MLQPVFWITGLSAAGKTTLSLRLAERLSESGKIALLDGEDLRSRLTRKYGHNLDDRYALLPEIVSIARESQKRGNLVIVATISHKVDMRMYARQSLRPYFEIYLKADVKDCASRDNKGLYERALAGSGEFVAGVSEPYEEGTADLILNVTDGNQNELFHLASAFVDAVLSQGNVAARL